MSEAVRPDLGPLSRGERIALLVLLLLGAFLLLFRFPQVPVGLHRDEISEAYESYALLHTGADRWGYHLPAYFLSWGSGQNVLQAYLNIPFIALFGLSPLGVRLLPLLLNLACLPIFFLAVRRWYGNRTALLALAFLALSPWHIMLSRWGIENSPLPFFLALGLWTFGYALGTHYALRILPSLLPFALAMYTYGVVIVWVPVFVFLLLLIDWPAVRGALRLWAGALALAVFLALPLLLFTVKNYVFKRNFAIERFLPFSIPLLPHSRLAEAKGDPLGASNVLHHNLKFFAYSLADNHANFTRLLPWYQLADVHSVQTVVYLLAALTFALLLAKSLRARRPLEPAVPWLFSSLLLMKVIPLNTSRAGGFFLPILALAAFGFNFLLARMRSKAAKQAAFGALAILVLVPMLRFSREYYGPSYAAQIAPNFDPHMGPALAEAHRLAGPDLPIYVSAWIPLNYVDVLYYDKVDPVLFQHSGATWNRPDFGQYHFLFTSLRMLPHPFVYLAPIPDNPVCPAPQHTQAMGELQVGLCP